MGGKYAQKKGKMIPRFFIELKYFSLKSHLFQIYEYKSSKIFQILIQLFSKYIDNNLNIFDSYYLDTPMSIFQNEKNIVIIVHGVEWILARADSEFVCVLKMILRRHCIAYFRSVYWPINAKNDLVFCSCFKCSFQ